jgi:hypothetical protein
MNLRRGISAEFFMVLHRYEQLSELVVVETAVGFRVHTQQDFYTCFAGEPSGIKFQAENVVGPTCSRPSNELNRTLITINIVRGISHDTYTSGDICDARGTLPHCRAEAGGKPLCGCPMSCITRAPFIAP